MAGRELSSIEFVQDYLQFRFGGPNLTVITHPVLIKKDRIIKRDSVEFCNEILGLIGQTVVLAEVNEEDAIKIKFEKGTLIYISLKPENYRDVEAAWFDYGAA